MEFNLADLFECVVDAAGEREALVAGQRRLTHGELDRRANRLAHHLAARGVEAGQHMGILAINRAEWVEAMLAAFKIRAVPINVNYRYVESELAYLFDNADLVALVYERRFGPLVGAVRLGLPKLRHLVVLEDESTEDAERLGAIPYEEALAAASPERGFPPRSPDDRYVIYTGGTTGMPKGVVWRHEDAFFGALGGGNWGGPGIARPEDLAANARKAEPASQLVTAPMMHGGGQWVTLGAFYTGDRVVLYTGRGFDAAEIWRLAERERVTSVAIVGDAMGRPLAEALAEPGARYDLAALRLVGSGGAILSPAVKEELRGRLPGVLVMDSFGASESGYQGSVLDMGRPAAGPRFTVNEQTAVLDEKLRPVTPGSGAVGRLARRGHVPVAYYKDPEKTAATFVEVDGARWVLPGDWARVEADAAIHLLGRGSVCINSGGEKIFPEEVEAVVKSHPDVFDVVVVGLPDARWGERVVAVVQPRPGRRVTLAAVDAHCRPHLAGYKLPRDLVCVDAIARTPAGKPDYRRAKEMAGTLSTH